MNFRKFSPRFWRDERIRLLSIEDKLVAVYGITAQSNRIGCFNFSPALAAEDLSLSPETFRKRFGNVTERLNWTFCEEHRVLFLPSWWKYNAPENPNVLIGSLRDLEQLPICHAVSAFCANAEHLEGNVRETFRETLAKRYGERSGERSAPVDRAVEVEREGTVDASSSLRSEEAAAPISSRFREAIEGTKLAPLLNGAAPKGWWSKLEKHEAEYPWLDVAEELRAAARYLETHRRTKLASFFGNWLNRTIERGREKGRPGARTFANRKAAS